MDKTLRNVLIGLGVAAAVGVVVYIALDEDVQEKTEALVNRMRAKAYVQKNLDGNDTAMKAIDKMSDEDINNLLETVDRLDDINSKITGTASNLASDVKDKAVDFKDNVVDYAQDIFS